MLPKLFPMHPVMYKASFALVEPYMWSGVIIWYGVMDRLGSANVRGQNIQRWRLEREQCRNDRLVVEKLTA